MTIYYNHDTLASHRLQELNLMREMVGMVFKFLGFEGYRTLKNYVFELQIEEEDVDFKLKKNFLQVSAIEALSAFSEIEFAGIFDDFIEFSRKLLVASKSMEHAVLR